MRTLSLVSLTLTLAALGCKDKSKPAAEDTPTKAVKTEGADPAALGKRAAEIAARPRVKLSLPQLGEAFGYEIVVPQGTLASDGGRTGRTSVHLETGRGEFMVNIVDVDESSAMVFDQAIEVYKSDKLVEWYKKEKTAKGWVTYKQVISALYKAPRFEVSVRVDDARAFDCGASAAVREYAELALEVCQTLRADLPISGK